MPLLAAVAVTLCSAMVIVVWAVMGGFLTHLVNSGRSLVGDVSVEVPISGFSHYDELIKRLEASPQVEAATPAILTQALLVTPMERKELVLVRGIDAASFARVTTYRDALWWRPLDAPMPKDKKREDPRLTPGAREQYKAAYENGLSLTVPAESGTGVGGGVGGRDPAIVLGVEVSGINRRQPEGYYKPGFYVGDHVTLHVLPMSPGGKLLDAVSLKLEVANEVQTGVYEYDRKSTLVSLGALQRALQMDASRRIAPPPPAGSVVIGPGGKETFPAPVDLGEEPARVTTVYVRGKGDVGDAAALKETVQTIVDKFSRDFPAASPRFMFAVSTWKDLNRQFIGAVEKETGLVLILFSFISVVAVFLVFAIFWSMVVEKTKDIGILRALGASRSGVAWLWIRYGLAIGIVGAILGLGLSFLIVTNINEIHEAIGRTFGVYVWDPKIYYFNEIPAKFKWFDASIVIVAGILSSGIGAFIPAIRAAWMDPVKAIRFE